MRNTAAANPSHSHAPLEFTIQKVQPQEWHKKIPDYATRMKRMSHWCNSWVELLRREEVRECSLW